MSEATKTNAPQPHKYTKKDFESDQDVRWCPGCGDYAILSAVQKMMPDLGIPREDIIFISGIGCSSRFPYYMNTYGFHTIHGRAPAIATGLRLARPDRKVPHMEETLKRAANHKGAAFVEILQNCNIYNDLAWNILYDRESKIQHELRLEHGKPLQFGPVDDRRGLTRD